MRRGAFDYLPKPFTPDQLLLLIRKITEVRTLEQKVAALQEALNEAALGRQFTNELGVGGRVRFLKNITGLWLLPAILSRLISQNGISRAAACNRKSAPDSSPADFGPIFPIRHEVQPDRRTCPPAPELWRHILAGRYVGPLATIHNQ